MHFRLLVDFAIRSALEIHLPDFRLVNTCATTAVGSVRRIHVHNATVHPSTQC
jgi:hypothetical protein